MADDILDLSPLLAPLGDGDAGEDLRQDYSPSSIYQRLRDARSEARAEERQRDSDTEAGGSVADGWRHVRRLAVEVLEGKSKDFEIAAWLTEALVRQDGLPGLATGARLLAGLLEQYWEAGFPQPDMEGSEDERMEGRSAPLGGLAGAETDGTVMQALRRAPLFRRPSGDHLSLYQYEAAVDTAGIADEARREQRFAQGVIALDAIEAEAKFDRPRLASAAALAGAARAAWQQFQDQCEARFPDQGPATRRVAEVLDRMMEVAKLLGGGEAAEAGLPDAAPMVAGIEAAPAALPGFKRVMGPLLRSAAEGADTAVWLCATDRDDLSPGAFYLDRQERGTVRWPKTATSASDRARLRLLVDQQAELG